MFVLVFVEAIRIKYRLSYSLLNQCYNDLLKNKLSNFLHEERKREARLQLRHEERTLKIN